ncbi:MAG: hypothetical protein JST68_10300 [Bacteroidetes bacterium]|nr:hypothetical protein [Bacteroidota bacterium]
MLSFEQSQLWDKIQAFTIDDAAAERPFSAKLAALQRWSPLFTQKAIGEYKKFLFLCCILDNGAAPSKVVDEVWHLHLTYTRSYWIELCQGTLGKEIHHHPSTGGVAEDEKHRDWYGETLRAYKEVFGMEAPVDVWPTPAGDVAVSEDAGGGVKAFLRSVFSRAAIGVVLLPFLFIAAAYHTINPFELGGPHFLVFFPVFGVALMAVHILLRVEARRRLRESLEADFPPDVSIYQIADPLFGKQRALQAAIIQLKERGLLELQGDDRFLVRKDHYSPDSGETNPLIAAFERAANGSVVSYEEIMVGWYDRWKFTHPSLDRLEVRVRRIGRFLPYYIPQLLFVFVFIARMAQGLANDRPIGDLMKEMALMSFVFVTITVLLVRGMMVPVIVRKLFSERVDGLNGADYVAGRYTLIGTSAIIDYPEGPVLTKLFGAYVSIGALGSFNARDRRGGDGGSSCSGGGSCGSSGGSSCGSSCGGCSGGH